MENFRLKVFRTVAKQLNFRKAAELLHLSQPAVSQQVHALEEELGIALFDRSGSRVQLTAAGALLLKYARKAAQLAAEAREAIERLQGKGGGELRLGASTTPAQYILPRMLGAFRKQHPRTAISVISGNTERIVAALLNDEITLGIIEGPAASRALHKQLFLKEKLVLIVAKKHPWARSRSIPLSSLSEASLLLRERGSGTRRVVELALKRAGLRLSQLQVMMELDSTEAIVAGVEAGLGVGFVPERAIAKELRLGTLSTVKLEGLEVQRDITFIRRAGPALEGAAAAFEQFALREAQALKG
ncbi:MAG TPA: LysR substrate-binding domain-containing protein [Acidobacteriaceae bacterium]|nr:LysR substrate-binding domain-containing protein [Acidobacteriaceae bacterium]